MEIFVSSATIESLAVDGVEIMLSSQTPKPVSWEQSWECLRMV